MIKEKQLTWHLQEQTESGRWETEMKNKDREKLISEMYHRAETGGQRGPMRVVSDQELKEEREN